SVARSAYGRGLVGGPLLKSLERFSQGLASEEGQKAYERAANTYSLDRGTNAQNFDQLMAQYKGGLEGFNANVGAGLGYKRNELEAQRMAQDAGQQAIENQYRQQAYTDAVNAQRQAQVQAQGRANPFQGSTAYPLPRPGARPGIYARPGIPT